MNERPDLRTFEVGSIYRHTNTGSIVEYLGEAFMSELNGEVVGVFRFVDDSGACLIATRLTWRLGASFQPYGDALDDERNLMEP